MRRLSVRTSSCLDDCVVVTIFVAILSMSFTICHLASSFQNIRSPVGSFIGFQMFYCIVASSFQLSLPSAFFAISFFAVPARAFFAVGVFGTVLQHHTTTTTDALHAPCNRS